MSKQKVQLPSTAVGRGRLLKLADLLIADAKNKKGIKFDLGTWASAERGSEIGVSCGTTACAMGLAAVSGAFKREGLTYGHPDCGQNGCRTCKSIIEVKLGDHTGLDAASKLFSIKYTEAEWLFSHSDYPDNLTTGADAERNVAKRIRDFVAGKQAPPETVSSGIGNL